MSSNNDNSNETSDSQCVVESKDETTCPVCNKDFDAYRHLSLHCSHGHDESLLLKQQCAWCESDIIKPKSEYAYNTERHFCDMDCQSEWRSETLVGKDAPQWGGGDTTRPCNICGGDVHRRPSYFEKYDRVTCSKECYSKLQSKLNKGEKNANYDPEAHAETTCEYCDTVFEYTISNAPNGRIYCSKSCRGKDLTGPLSPNWKGGWVNGDYGANWRKQRKKALERDKYQCVMCGLDSDSAKEKTNSPLHVHHRIRKEEFRNEDGSLDYEKANAVSNLITLCVVCHGRWEEMPIQPKVY